MTDDQQKASSLQRPSIPVSELLGDKISPDNRHILWSYPTHVTKKSPEKESSPNKLSIKRILHPSDWQVTPLQSGIPQPLRPLKIKKRGTQAVFRRDISAFVFNDSLPALNFEPETVMKRNNSVSTNNRYDGLKKTPKFLSQTKETTPVSRINSNKKEFTAYEADMEVYGSPQISNFHPYDRILKLSAQNPKIDDMFGPEKKKMDKLPKGTSEIEKLPISFQNLYQKINDLQKESDAKLKSKEREKTKNDMLLGLKLETRDNHQQGTGNNDTQASLRGSPVQHEIDNLHRNSHGTRNKIKSVSGSSKIVLSPLIKTNVRPRNKSVKHLNPLSNGISKRTGEINPTELYRVNRDDANRSDRFKVTEITGTYVGYSKDSKDNSQDVRYDDIQLPSTSTFRNSPEPRISLKPLLDSVSLQDPQERILLSITQINTRFIAREDSPKRIPRSPNTFGTHNYEKSPQKSPTPLPEPQSTVMSPEKLGDLDNVRTEPNIGTSFSDQKKKPKSRCVTLETHPFRGSLEKQLADQYGDQDTVEGWENADESETS